MHGAGRTDAGVHALGQVASIRMPGKLMSSELKKALNSLLPNEIRIRGVRRAPYEFHARRDAVEKEYRYLLLSSSEPSPFTPFYSSLLPYRLAVDRMREAATALVGRHDFKSFQASGSLVKSTIRELRNLDIKQGGAFVSISVVADGFLRHMVRIIVGTLIEIGRGKMEPEEMSKILVSKDRRLAGPTAPPEGLTLVKVMY